MVSLFGESVDEFGCKFRTGMDRLVEMSWTCERERERDQ